MSTLYVTFIPPSPVPSQYKIRYKQTTDPSYIEVVYPSTGLSPEEFSITGVTSGVNYSVEVQSYCGRGVYAAGFPVISAANDCQEYTFTNPTGSAQPLIYRLCSDPTNTVTISVPNGDTEGPLCLSNGFGGPYTNTGGLTVITGSPCTP